MINKPTSTNNDMIDCAYTHGFVYILSNPSMPGIVKIGKTKRPDVKIRVNELYTTGVPVPFDVEYACKLSAGDCDKLEKALHTAFGPARINESREFFKIHPSQAIAILELFDNREEVTEEINEEIQSELSAVDKIAQQKVKRSQRPPIHFLEMGIPIGATLQYIPDETITVEVIEARRVLFQGEAYYLTVLTRELRGLGYNIQPTPFWTYEGRNLQEIYDETFPREEE